MTIAVRGKITTILASRYLQNVQRAHSNVDWNRNICQPMALITAMISKDTLTYGEMNIQPDKPQFIRAMQKEIFDHEQRKHWKLVHRLEIKWSKNDYGNLVFQAKKGQHHGKCNKIQGQNLCARWNARKRYKLLGNVCSSGAMDER